MICERSVFVIYLNLLWRKRAGEKLSYPQTHTISFHLEIHTSVGKQCTHQSVVLMVKTHHFFPMSKCVCLHASKRRKKKIAEANRYKNASSINDFSLTQLNSAQLSSAQRNETENFCLFVVIAVMLFDFPFHIRMNSHDFFIFGASISYRGWWMLRSNFMCMMCSIYFIFMFSKANACVCFLFFSISIHFC